MRVNLRVVSHTLALVLLVSIANVVLLFALVVKPINENASWRIACGTAEWFWSYMQNHWETSRNVKDGLEITGDEIPEKEGAIVISNHLSYGDYYLVQALASRKGMLGKCRYFVKKEIVWQIPIFGWAFWAIGMILVSRNWTNDSRLIEDAFGRIKANGHDAWIVLYPEGTRRTEKKVLQSRAFARQNGKPELERVLLPRAKGFQATIKGLRGSHIKHVYDLTFQYTSPGKDAEKVPSLDDQLSKRDITKAGYRFRVHVDRIPIADIPEDDDGIKTWLDSRWEAKDRLLSSWIERRKGQSDRDPTGSRVDKDKRRQSVSLTVHSERDPGVKAKQQVVEVQSGRVKAE